MQTKLKSVNLSHVVSSGTETEDRLTEPGGGGKGMRGGQWDVRAAVIKSAFVVECLIAHRDRAKVTTPHVRPTWHTFCRLSSSPARLSY